MVIAERILLLCEDGRDTVVPVRIFAPRQEPLGWMCHTQIHWPDQVATFTAHGLDGMQALHLALQHLGARLCMSDARRQGRLRSGAPGTGYGFPVPGMMRDERIGDDARFDGETPAP